MAHNVKPFRRVVTGHDAEGKSCVIYDSAAPSTFVRPSGTEWNEMWTIESMPAPLKGNKDYGSADRTLSHSPPAGGAHWRVSYTPGPMDNSDATREKERAMHGTEALSGTQRKKDAPHWRMHRTLSIDYSTCLMGERYLILEEDKKVLVRKSDVVIQLGNWHTWESDSPDPGMISYVMIGGEYAADE